MLDDLKKIHERDASDALGNVQKAWKQLTYDFQVMPILEPTGVNNIVFAGMGNSALAALLIPVWPTTAIPFDIIRNYDLPAYVGASTLFIACSYSGNTEETIAAITQAENKGARIAVIAGGGTLAAVAREKAYPLVLLPPIQQPRFGVFYILKALITLLAQAEVSPTGLLELTLQTEFLKKATDSWAPTVPTKDNLAKQIALECIGKSIVVYAGPKLFPAAYKWKIGLNENAKQIAWCNQLPEFNHNEFIGWSKQPQQKPYAIIDLRSSLEHLRVQKRFEVTDRLLSGLRPSSLVVNAYGDSILQQLLWTMQLGDFVSIYTGLLNGLNPTPIELVETFKEKMEQ